MKRQLLQDLIGAWFTNTKASKASRCFRRDGWTADVQDYALVCDWAAGGLDGVLISSVMRAQHLAV